MIKRRCLPELNRYLRGSSGRVLGAFPYLIWTCSTPELEQCTTATFAADIANLSKAKPVKNVVTNYRKK